MSASVVVLLSTGIDRISRNVSTVTIVKLRTLW